MYIYCIRLQINKHVCLSVCLSGSTAPPPPPPGTTGMFLRNKPILTVVLLDHFHVYFFLVPILHAGYLCYYTALSQVVQFVKDRVRLLECSPACCLAPGNHCEEKGDKFITCRINNKSPSHFGFDTCRYSVD